MPRAALAIVEPTEELSYDSLFAATLDATVIIDSLCGSIISANAEAARLLGVPRSALAGKPLPTLVDARAGALLWAALATTRVEGVALIETLRFRRAALELSARLSLVRAGENTYVLAHFSPARDEPEMAESLHGGSLVYDAVDRGAAVLVVTDADLSVLYANRAFLRLIEVESLQEARGQALSQWLELSCEDLGRMRVQMAAREMATTVSVRLNAGRHGTPYLQALAIAVPDGGQSMWAFSISERSRSN